MRKERSFQNQSGQFNEEFEGVDDQKEQENVVVTEIVQSVKKQSFLRKANTIEVASTLGENSLNLARQLTATSATRPQVLTNKEIREIMMSYQQFKKFPKHVYDNSKETNEKETIKMLQIVPNHRTNYECFEILKMLLKFEFFTQLINDKGPSILLKVAQLMEKEQYKKGDIVVKYGDPGNKVYFIIKGRVSVYVPNGQETSQKLDIISKNTIDRGQLVRIDVNSLHEGKYFGELALINQSVRSASVMAGEDLVLGTLRDRQFDILLSSMMDRLSEQAEFLKSLQYFNQLTDRTIATLSYNFIAETKNKGEIIISQGQVPKFVFFIKSGSLRKQKQMMVELPQKDLDPIQVAMQYRSVDESNLLLKQYHRDGAIQKNKFQTFKLSLVGEGTLLCFNEASKKQKIQYSLIAETRLEIMKITSANFFQRIDKSNNPQVFNILKRMSDDQSQWQNERVEFLKKTVISKNQSNLLLNQSNSKSKIIESSKNNSKLNSPAKKKSEENLQLLSQTVIADEQFIGYQNSPRYFYNTKTNVEKLKQILNTSDILYQRSFPTKEDSLLIETTRSKENKSLETSKDFSKDGKTSGYLKQNEWITVQNQNPDQPQKELPFSLQMDITKTEENASKVQHPENENFMITIIHQDSSLNSINNPTLPILNLLTPSSQEKQRNPILQGLQLTDNFHQSYDPELNYPRSNIHSQEIVCRKPSNYDQICQSNENSFEQLNLLNQSLGFKRNPIISINTQFSGSNSLTQHNSLSNKTTTNNYHMTYGSQFISNQLETFSTQFNSKEDLSQEDLVQNTSFNASPPVQRGFRGNKVRTANQNTSNIMTSTLRENTVSNVFKIRNSTLNKDSKSRGDALNQTNMCHENSLHRSDEGFRKVSKPHESMHMYMPLERQRQLDKQSLVYTTSKGSVQHLSSLDYLQENYSSTEDLTNAQKIVNQRIVEEQPLPERDEFCEKVNYNGIKLFEVDQRLIPHTRRYMMEIRKKSMDTNSFDASFFVLQKYKEQITRQKKQILKQFFKEVEFQQQIDEVPMQHQTSYFTRNLKRKILQNNIKNRNNSYIDTQTFNQFIKDIGDQADRSPLIELTDRKHNPGFSNINFVIQNSNSQNTFELSDDIDHENQKNLFSQQSFASFNQIEDDFESSGPNPPPAFNQKFKILKGQNFISPNQIQTQKGESREKESFTPYHNQPNNKSNNFNVSNQKAQFSK